MQRKVATYTTLVGPGLAGLVRLGWVLADWLMQTQTQTQPQPQKQRQSEMRGSLRYGGKMRRLRSR
jgi:hypothetical protein